MTVVDTPRPRPGGDRSDLLGMGVVVACEGVTSYVHGLYVSRDRPSWSFGLHCLCVWPQPGCYSLGRTGILR